MNPIKQIFADISDSDIKQAVKEIKEDGETGYIRIDGLHRKIAQQISEITGNSITTELFMTEIGILREAAYRWCK